MKMIDSVSKKNIAKLISKNSDLPIIPIVILMTRGPNTRAPRAIKTRYTTA